MLFPYAFLKIIAWHGFDDKAYQFISLYRRHFKLPPSMRGKRVFIDFDGVMTAAVVSINGQRLGEYRGGYTPFSFELTQHINWHGDNVLAVEVDSTKRKDIPPPRAFSGAWGDLRMDGYIAGRKVISKTLSRKGATNSSILRPTMANLSETASTLHA